MAKDEKKEEAKKYYVRENKDISEIASLLDVAETSVYRWKKEDKEANQDWDEKRAIWNLTPSELEKVYIECVKELVLKIKEKSELMLDSKVADAMSKHIANLRKMNPRALYMGIGFELIVVMDKFLIKTDKSLREKLVRYYDGIKDEFKNFAEIKQL